MATPEECPNCGSDYIGIDPATNVYVCLDCGYRIGIAGPPMIDPFFHGDH